MATNYGIDAMTETGNNAVAALFSALIYHVGVSGIRFLADVLHLIHPGTKLILTDNRFNNRTLTCTGHVRDILYDFVGKKINIEGSTVSLTST